MPKVTKSEELETKRQALETKIKNVTPGDVNSVLLQVALASLETQIAILHHIERNVRN